MDERRVAGVDHQNGTLGIEQRTQIEPRHRLHGGEAVAHGLGRRVVLCAEPHAVGPQPQPEQSRIVEHHVGERIDMAERQKERYHQPLRQVVARKRVLRGVEPPFREIGPTGGKDGKIERRRGKLRLSGHMSPPSSIKCKMIIRKCATRAATLQFQMLAARHRGCLFCRRE